MRKVKFRSRALDQEFEVGRVIGEFHGNSDGPALIFFAGLHGNEPAGVIALMRVMEELNQLNPKLKGSVYALTGNLNALQKNVRFESVDMNRMWTDERIESLRLNGFSEKEQNSEYLEQQELFQIGEQIFSKHKQDILCVDLHTTSSQSVPFLTMNDSVVNRNFAEQFEVPAVLGIDQYLDGTLLNWTIPKGVPNIVFESGTHDSISSIDNHESFAWLSLVYSGLMDESEMLNFSKHSSRLASVNPEKHGLFKIFYKKEIARNEQFSMKSGYVNFSSLERDEIIAESSIDNEIKVSEDCRIFMPLYQGKGTDGYFLIRNVE